MSLVKGAPGPPNSLEIRGLHVSLAGTPVLGGLDLEVGASEILALLGPSGCGKTTLLRSVAGFVTPARGCIAINGGPVAGGGVWIQPQHRNVGLVPQEGSLFPHLDVAGNVGFGLDSIPRRQRAERVAECLELVGLTGMGSRRPGDLSGGQQQRVALARALAPEPPVVLLDEPFSALDTSLRQQVREDVRAVLHTAGVAAVLVTHDQQEALSFSQRVAVMEHGRIAQVADPQTLYAHPVTLGVGTFLGESTVIPATLLEAPEVRAGHAVARAESALGHIPVQLPDGLDHCRRPCHGEPLLLLIRPEQVELHRFDAGRTMPANTVPGEVVSTSYFGHDALVRLELEPGLRLTARVATSALPEVGSPLAASISGPVVAFGA